MADPGGGPPYFSTKLGLEASKKFVETGPPPPPPNLSVWITEPPLSEGLDPPLLSVGMFVKKYLDVRSTHYIVWKA